MPIRLPNDRLRPWPTFQVYAKLDTNLSQWTKIDTMGSDVGNFPFSDIERPQKGIHVGDISTRALPNFSTVTLTMAIGNINTVNYNFKDGDITAIDLKNKEIYITMSLDGGDGDSTPRIVFWGVVDYQKDNLSAAANPHIIGTRNYKASDLLYYTTHRAQMNKHGYGVDGYTINRAPGMPHYNGRSGRADLRQGNKATSVTMPAEDTTEPIAQRYGDGDYQLRRFTFDSTGGFWTDKEVILHAVHTGQQTDKLIAFDVEDPAALLNSQDNTWPVSENERAWNFIKRILRFQRGAGVSVFTWDTSPEIEPLNPRILVHPIHLESIDVNLPSTGSQQNILGASDLAITTAVDITGDHRHVDSFFSLGGIEDYHFERVEVVGEKIQVLCTLSTFENTLAPLWSDTDQDTFDNLDQEKIDRSTHDHIYRLFGVPRNWNGITGDGNNGSSEPDGIFFWCDDAGVIRHSGLGVGAPPACNPSTLRILPDIPLHDGIDPKTGERSDGGNAIGVSARHPLLAYQRSGDNDYLSIAATPRIRSDGIWLGSRDIIDNKARPIGNGDDMTDALDKLLITLAIELPNRVHLAHGKPASSAENTKRIMASGAHLWIGANNTPYSISEDNTIKRLDETTYLRDDRDRIAYIAALAKTWYLDPHRAAKWALRDCGLGGSFHAHILPDANSNNTGMHDDSGRSIPVTASDATEPIPYPQLGHIVTTLTAAAGKQELNAPITSIRYDNTQGTTYWIADWGELEL